ncbi:MAG: hypothetical protein NZ529_11300 [Cytophagaceae bacterium]|nr:hypothetical protein [Cytophagaceae bacterium]MDW8457370.1 hypothetical protein [Cytophagaceae bacterium]
MSDWFMKLPRALSDECLIIANGPSMSETLNQYEHKIKEKVLLTVNNIVSSSHFFNLKPHYHVLHDPGYFLYKNRPDVIATFNVLKTQVNWELTLFVPYIFRKDADIVWLQKSKGSVKVVLYNYAIMHGFDRITFLFYRKNLAMPQFYNVLGPSVFLCLNMGYKKIWITGADHSWFKEVEVSENNELYRRDTHFYDTSAVPPTPIIDETNQPINIGRFLEYISKVFNSYYTLERYSKTLDAKIFNATEYSLIDAFERKKL